MIYNYRPWLKQFVCIHNIVRIMFVNYNVLLFFIISYLQRHAICLEYFLVIKGFILSNQKLAHFKIVDALELLAYLYQIHLDNHSNWVTYEKCSKCLFIKQLFQSALYSNNFVKLYIFGSSCLLDTLVDYFGFFILMLIFWWWIVRDLLFGIFLVLIIGFVLNVDIYFFFFINSGHF